MAMVRGICHGIMCAFCGLCPGRGSPRELLPPITHGGGEVSLGLAVITMAKLTLWPFYVVRLFVFFFFHMYFHFTDFPVK